jgi:hypothetical protein
MDWLRADEVAVALGKPVGTVYVIAHRNKWPKATAGKHTFYSRTAIRDYLEGNK